MKMANKKRDRLISLFSVLFTIVITAVLIFFIFPEEETMADDGALEEFTREVDVQTFSAGDITSEIHVTGRARATERIELTSEVQGVLQGGEHPFRTGVRFSEGDTIMVIDDREEALALTAERARFLTTISGTLSDIRFDYPDDFEAWENYAADLNPEERLKPLPDISDRQLRLFLTSRGVFDQYYTIRSSENRLDKFVITAPYSGELRNADVTPGNLVQAGVTLGEFVGDRFEIETFVSLQDLPFIGTGSTVSMESPAFDDALDGRVIRIGSSIDPETQAFPVYIELQEPSIRSGLYFEGVADGRIIPDAVEIPRNLLTRSNTVLVVEDEKATHKEVEPIRFRDETVIVTGLSEEDKLIELRAGVSNLAGSRVTIRDEDSE